MASTHYDVEDTSAFASTSRLEDQQQREDRYGSVASAEMARGSSSSSAASDGEADDFAILYSDEEEEEDTGARSSPPSSRASVTNLCTAAEELATEHQGGQRHDTSSATLMAPAEPSTSAHTSFSSSSAASSDAGDSAQDDDARRTHQSSTASLPSLCSSATSMSIHEEAVATPSAKQESAAPFDPQPRNASIDSPLSHARSLLEHQAASLLSAARRLREEEETSHSFSHAQQLVTDTLRGGGKLVWTGVGKSGIIARKLASTSLSLGMPATWLDPTEALHGDLGLLNGSEASSSSCLPSSSASSSSQIPRPPQDLLLALSHSGSSKEVATLLPHVERRRVRIIALTAKRDSPLGQAAQRSGGAWLDCRTATASNDAKAQPACSACNAAPWSYSGEGTDEADPCLPAPSSSTTTALAMGDSLVLSCAKALGLGEREFAKNHPGGALGQRFLAQEAEEAKRAQGKAVGAAA
ncbi:SIS domain-containing protein [Jaminaea rosea]|uniref:SIS domain-containing protein n=1 Tax=Jaminaea rosea TaxID=1569628 RepID=A0A316UH98_9BASI|nr:SIS domain-containing protein [Jaminaea rosea]PWN24646.1 SIS domain-containing protein [Jaminaea rosea]